MNPYADLIAPIAYRSWDSDRRLAETESDGIAAEVLFPNTVPPFFAEGNLVALPPTPDDYERRWAGVQAHNRWLADFCAGAPGRRAGIVQVFANDMDDAVAEVRWAAETFDSPSAASCCRPSRPTRTCRRCGRTTTSRCGRCAPSSTCPINIHGGSALPDYGEHEAARAMMLIEIPWFSHRSVWHLIFSGVLERHPTLRFAVTEQGVAWLPRGLETLDWFYGRMTTANAAEAKFFGAAAAKMTMTPSEYFARNFWIGASFLRPSEAPLCHDLGIDHVMWGADYPHSEGSYPYTTEALRVAFADYPRARGAGHGRVDGGLLLRLRPRPAATDRRPRRPAGRRGGAAARPRGLADRDDLQRIRPHADPACLVTQGGNMQTVRYGARAVQVNREIEAKKADIWSEAVTAVYETDPEIIAAVLPPPLEPGPEPLVRITITRSRCRGSRCSGPAGSACRPATGTGWASTRSSCR